MSTASTLANPTPETAPATIAPVGLESFGVSRAAAATCVLVRRGARCAERSPAAPTLPAEVVVGSDVVDAARRVVEVAADGLCASGGGTTDAGGSVPPDALVTGTRVSGAFVTGARVAGGTVAGGAAGHVDCHRYEAPLEKFRGGSRVWVAPAGISTNRQPSTTSGRTRVAASPSGLYDHPAVVPRKYDQ